VLGSANSFGGLTGGAGASFGSGGPGGAGPGGPGFGGPGFGGPSAGPLGGSTVSWLNLPFMGIFRSEAVVTAVAIGQTLGFAALLGTWLVVAFGPLMQRRGARAADAEPTTA